MKNIYFQKSLLGGLLFSFGDNLHGVSKPVFRGKLEKYFKKLSAEFFTQHAKY